MDLAQLLRKRWAEIQRPVQASGRIKTALNAASTSDDVEPFTTEIIASPGFEWLARNDHFRAAKRLFDECIKKSTAPSWQVAKQEVRFVYTVAQYVGFYFCTPNWRPRYASAEQKRKAVSTADSLLELMGQGANMSDLLEEFELKRLLTRYRDELTVTQGARQYSGPKAGQRDMLEVIAKHLLSIELEERHVVNVVKEIALLFGFSVDHRSVQRYVQRAAVELEKR